MMYEDVHYSKIGDNYLMLKPGLDLLCTSASLVDIYDEPVVIDEGENHKTYKYKCKLMSIVKDIVVARGEGEASTMETKFRYQNEWRNGVKNKVEIPPEKVYDKYYVVIQIAKTRAKRNAVNSFFAPAGFFASETPPQKNTSRAKMPVDKQVAAEDQFSWKYDLSDMNNPEWFKKQIRDAKSGRELDAFAKQFKMELGCFAEQDMLEISTLAGQKREELKK